MGQVSHEKLLSVLVSWGSGFAKSFQETLNSRCFQLVPYTWRSFPECFLGCFQASEVREDCSEGFKPGSMGLVIWNGNI